MMSTNNRRFASITGAAVLAAAAAAGPARAADESRSSDEPGPEALEDRISELEDELHRAWMALAEAAAAGQAANERAEEAAKKLESVELEPARIRFGNFTVGGALRANYTIGDYPETAGASRAVSDGGNFNLDTFRVNIDYLNEPWTGKLEYRWYNGYHFLHTGWVGYRFKNNSQIQVGVNRVPFGPGPYGVSQSWFFDQHYYLGLSDDMDLGAKYRHTFGQWAVDLGYYYGDEGDYKGASRDSARYSYDVVNESGRGYRERNQINARAVYNFTGAGASNAAGVSLQHGGLDSTGEQDDGDHSAASLHMTSKWERVTLAGQLTYYAFDVDADQPLGTDERVQVGAYDFPNTIASRAWVPAVSLSYYKATPGSGWLDYVIPYAEYSTVVKRESGFNDSELFVLGAAWGWGGWYIYTDLAVSNGNEFVGGETPFGDRLGANADDDRATRFNINFGYYF